jgi:hypothetical protein
MNWSRRRESNARPLTYHVSALAFAELRRLGAGGRTRTCSAPKRVTFWAWCVYLFRHAGKVARVGFQPTVSWMKARHVGALHQRAIAMVPPPGVEPGTARVRAVCSGQLSYGGDVRKRSVTEESDLQCSDRAPVLQTGRGTTRMSPKLRKSADGETRTPS